jgi:protein ImuB
MKRIVSVWFPHWPVERLRRADPAAAPRDEPLALVVHAAGGIRISDLNEAARAEGLLPGGALADARAVLPRLASRPAQPARDHRALVDLARWCDRFAPACNIDITSAQDSPVRDHGLWLDITGAAHLFGGEAALLATLSARFAGFGVTARLALADTYGAAYALARFGTSAARPTRLVAAGAVRAALQPLPVAALRLPMASITTLRRLGLGRIGDLAALPRETLARRFYGPDRGAFVLNRLDQALGAAQEPLAALVPPPVFAARLCFAEPLISAEAIASALEQLAASLCADLTAAGAGARRLALSLYRADGTMSRIFAGTSAPTRDREHLLGIFADRLVAVDAGFGIDSIVFGAVQVERQEAGQITLSRHTAQACEARSRLLVDRLANRLGAAAVSRLVPVASHLPERAQSRRPALAGATPGGWLRPKGLSRPPFLLDPPEPIAVTAEVPEGPPRRFTWRKVEHRVVKGEGPERLAPEWWRLSAILAAREESEEGKEGAEREERGQERPAPSRARKRYRPRDYYRLEDETGASFFVFREGLYGDEASGVPLWFVHGLYG